MTFLFFGTSVALLAAELAPFKDWEDIVLFLKPHCDQLFITEWTIGVSDEKAGQVEGGLCQKIINLKRMIRRHDLISQKTKTDYSI